MEKPSSNREIGIEGKPSLEKILDELSEFVHLAARLKRTTEDLKDFAMSDDLEQKQYAMGKLQELRLCVDESNLSGLKFVLNQIVHEGRV